MSQAPPEGLTSEHCGPGDQIPTLELGSNLERDSAHPLLYSSLLGFTVSQRPSQGPTVEAMQHYLTLWKPPVPPGCTCFPPLCTPESIHLREPACQHPQA